MIIRRNVFYPWKKQPIQYIFYTSPKSNFVIIEFLSPSPPATQMTSRYAPSQQEVEVGIEAQLKEAWAQNVQDSALLEALAQNVQD